MDYVNQLRLLLLTVVPGSCKLYRRGQRELIYESTPGISVRVRGELSLSHCEELSLLQDSDKHGPVQELSPLSFGRHRDPHHWFLYREVSVTLCRVMGFKRCFVLAILTGVVGILTNDLFNHNATIESSTPVSGIVGFAFGYFLVQADK